ncbi:MAG: hypothetical protein GTO63_21175, partial [Anaerolineae bacterium]|nr:hypothetical protein [Anaerolineae bacterium]NIN97311.1 hypothetical protein [Anaerolineae bacterium]
ASEWYEANGSVSRAIHHALVCEDLGRVLDLIEAHGLAALSQAEVRKVKGWFDSLPEELIRSRPYLCVLFAWTLWLTNYSDPPAAVDDWVKDAERALPVGRPVSKDEDWGKDQEVTAHIQSIRASMAFFRGEDPRMVIDLARQALDLVQERDCWLQSMLCHFISACHVVLGDIESAILFDEHALRYAKACDFDYLVIGIYYDQAVIAIRQGRL